MSGKDQKFEVLNLISVVAASEDISDLNQPTEIQLHKNIPATSTDQFNMHGSQLLP
jgi:hypothetical protein